MANNKVYTAPQAIILIDNKKAGYIRDISFSENIQRVDVRGLGSLNAQETDAVSISQTFNMSEFFIDFAQASTKALLNRMGGAEKLMNTLALGEFSFSIVMYKKEVVARDTNEKLVTEIDPTGTTKAILRDCYIDSQNFSLSEGGITSLGTSGRYLTPMAFK